MAAGLRCGRGRAPGADAPQLPVQPVLRVRGAGHLRGRGRLCARARIVARPRPRLRLPRLRRPSRPQRARDRGRARGRRRAVVASKVYGMAGWRVGFLVGNAELVARVQTLLDHVAAGVFTAVQRGLQAALEGDQADVAERREVYRRRRDALVERLGDTVTVPEGTFYAWWRLPDGVTVQELVERARVGLAPGEGFGARGAGWARMSLAVPDEDVIEGAERLAGALSLRARA